ncbi:receptor-like serine/threonine-protein kinase SD1-8 [Silene latifolia]|uniref:receptor-like serine/threonine-protein kinase SD1-8 n=1 Tax=Silene latifolia TaxID=37657 RepID=UPI003D782915
MSKILQNKITVLTQIFLCFSPIFSKSTDILTKSDVLPIDKTLISATGKFELGFFQRGTPTKYYVGIKYKDIPSDVIIWVANRDSPSFTDSTLLKFGNQSNIVICDGESKILWQTNKLDGVNPVLQLLDSGNLVIREAEGSNTGPFIWQSFDYPTDTLLPSQKFGLDFKTGLDRRLVSWGGIDDPSPGNFSLSVDYKGDHEIYLKKGDKIIFRSGPYDGERFSGVPEMKMGNEGYNFTSYLGSDEVYYMVVPFSNNVAKTRTLVTCDGIIENLIWFSNGDQWTKFWYARQDQCDYYGLCGPFGVCNSNAMFVCECPHGFKPKDSYAWNLRDWSQGCVRNTKLDCKNDGFLVMNNMKLPDTLSSFIDRTLSVDQCRDVCMENCSCTAYGNFEFGKDVGFGCLIWTNNLIDMRVFPEYGQTLYIRLSSSDLGSLEANGFTRNHKAVIGIGISIAVTIILIGLITLIIWNRRNSRNLQTGSELYACNTSTARRSQEIIFNGIITSYREYSGDAMNVDDVELPIFDLHSIVVATDYFSEANTLGQGGFGRVYKGVLLDGQEVAVKRLSRESGQGSEEFMNEVRLIAKLQHRNLVRLLGCCVDMDEKIIIYEYLQNRSLDCFLFDKTRKAMLTWEIRFNIICGVARGLLYLHQDSRYRIIHRDLKASNILLDVDMNPKISDFGMARIFGGDETQGNTMRIVGTYGYMAPEFAMDGLFSIKSDVFSFGVLVLEILSGTKNRGTFSSNNELNLLGHAWEQWRDGKGRELVDKSIGERYSIDEMLRFLQVGLLCVQERPEDRPSMGSVVLMLCSESMSLPLPKLPGFRMGWHRSENDSSSTKQDQSVTINQLTVSVIDPR